MSKTEIIAELPNLSPQNLAEIQSKLDELVGDSWQPHCELTDADKSTLDVSLAAYKKDPHAGTSWDQAKTRIQSKLRP